MKPALYDLANMLGCLGMEDPNALLGPLAVDLVARLRDQNYLDVLSWRLLLDYMIALRFAWLSEWLRYRDAKMVELEFTYMKLLIENKPLLLKAWSL